MTKPTLLDIVQEILSDMDSEEVNSISDTVEAEQVAKIVKSTYESMVAQKMIPEHRELRHLDGIGDSTRPNYLKLADDVRYVHQFRYKQTSTGVYYDVVYEEPYEFIDRVTSRDSTADNVQTVEDVNSAVDLYIYNDKRPQYWTSFDDEYIVCDSFDSDEDSTLQTTNTLAWVLTDTTFSITDDFVPDIDQTLFPALKQEAKAMAFALLKSSVNQKIEQSAKRNRVFLQNDKYRTQRPKRLKNYGR